jgi:2-amino-4-hydroxy-6-hydroxymethyldihydropteridine diphosphokinase
MPFVILGLGSNLGSRETYLKQAVDALKTQGLLKDMALSWLYESDAQLPDHAPAEWNKTFYNMAVRGDTRLSPPELLKAIKQIEAGLGRIKKEVWGPREIDIDILAYATRIYHDPNLTIPHPHLATRPFALLPLIEVSPEWMFPARNDDEKIAAKEVASAFPSPLPFNTKRLRPLS